MVKAILATGAAMPVVLAEEEGEAAGTGMEAGDAGAAPEDMADDVSEGIGAAVDGTPLGPQCSFDCLAKGSTSARGLAVLNAVWRAGGSAGCTPCCV